MGIKTSPPLIDSGKPRTSPLARPGMSEFSAVVSKSVGSLEIFHDASGLRNTGGRCSRARKSGPLGVHGNRGDETREAGVLELRVAIGLTKCSGAGLMLGRLWLRGRAVMEEDI